MKGPRATHLYINRAHTHTHTPTDTDADTYKVDGYYWWEGVCVRLLLDSLLWETTTTEKAFEKRGIRKLSSTLMLLNRQAKSDESNVRDCAACAKNTLLIDGKAQERTNSYKETTWLYRPVTPNRCLLHTTLHRESWKIETNKTRPGQKPSISSCTPHQRVGGRPDA